MSRVALFNSPLLLGFEHFERALDRVNKLSGDGYPPYNVEQTRRQCSCASRSRSPASRWPI